MPAVVETSTFSALVDEIGARSGRVERTADITAYARSTMRECTVLAEFAQNTIEGTVVVDAVPFILAVDKLKNYRRFEAIQYPYFDSHGQNIYAKERKPGKVKNPNDIYFFYRAGDSFIFNGLNINDSIAYAYQRYLPKLVYYANVSDRPARFDLETDAWIYHPDYIGNDILKQEGRDKVTNWMLFNWYDMILEGTLTKLTKLYKTVKDPRDKTSYALYKQQQSDLLAGESQVIAPTQDEG